MKRFKELLIVLAPVSLVMAVVFAQNVPISQMPISGTLQTNAWFPIIQPLPGRTTNDNARIAPSVIVDYISAHGGITTTNTVYTNTVYTNAILVTNYFLGAGTNVVLVTNVTGTNVTWTISAVPGTGGGAGTNYYVAAGTNVHILTNVVGTNVTWTIASIPPLVTNYSAYAGSDITIVTNITGTNVLWTIAAVRQAVTNYHLIAGTNVVVTTNRTGTNVTWTVNSDLASAFNPSTNFLPRLETEDTFADSSWYHIATNRYGFGDTNFFLAYSNSKSSLHVGHDHGTSASGANVTAIGESSAAFLTSGVNETFLGYNSGSGITSGNENTAIGAWSLFLGNVNNTTAVGVSAGVGLVKGTHSVLVGDYAGNSLVHADDSVIVGSHQLYDVTMTNVVNSVLLGAIDQTIVSNPATGLTNVIAIGHNVIVTNSNEIVIGNDTNTLAIIKATGFSGTGTNMLLDNGTWGPISGGGVSLNATDNYVPARLNSTSLTNTTIWQTNNGTILSMLVGAGRGANWYGASNIINIGYDAGSLTTYTNIDNSFVNIGRRAGQGAYADDAGQIHNFGNYAGSSSTYTNSSNIDNFGHSAGQASVYAGSGNIYAIGNESGLGTFYSNSVQVMALNGALRYGQVLETTNFTAIGMGAGESNSFSGLTNVVLIGSGSTTANNNVTAFGPNMNVYATNFISSIDVRYYGAKGDGITDDTAAIQAAINAGGQGSCIYIPAGTYKITGTLRMTNALQALRGAGSRLSYLVYSPTASGSAIIITNGTPSYHCQITGLGFMGASDAHTKVGIELADVSNVTIDDVAFNPWTGSATNSAAIVTRGRQFVKVSRASINADLPIHIMANPNSYISCDHFHFSDLDLISASGHPCILADKNANLFNTTFDGYQSWNLANWGFYWNCTNLSATSFNLKFANVRPEQSPTTNGWAFYIHHALTLYSLELDNCYLNADQNGVSLAGVKNASFRNVNFMQSTGLKQLQADSTCDSLLLDNIFSQQLGSADITGMTNSFSYATAVGAAPLPQTGYYISGTDLTTLPFTINSPTVNGVLKSVIQDSITNSVTYPFEPYHKVNSGLTPQLFFGTGIPMYADADGAAYELLGSVNAWWSTPAVADLTSYMQFNTRHDATNSLVSDFTWDSVRFYPTVYLTNIIAYGDNYSQHFYTLPNGHLRFYDATNGPTHQLYTGGTHETHVFPFNKDAAFVFEDANGISKSAVWENGGISVGNVNNPGTNNLSVTGTVSAGNGYIQQFKTSFYTNYSIGTATNQQLFLLNGTNQLITLPPAAGVAGIPYRFSMTNRYGSFVLTNAADGATVRDGSSLSYTNTGITSVSMISDGANWWLASRGKTILPSASWSLTNTITPLTDVITNIGFSNVEFNNSQGITLRTKAGYATATELAITNSGTYLLTYSAVVKGSGPGSLISIWLRQDGTDVIRTRTDQGFTSNTAQQCITVNYFVNVTTPSYFELVAASHDGICPAIISSAPNPTGYTAPAMPGIIVTVNKVSDLWP